jgi:hypothetical protein
MPAISDEVAERAAAHRRSFQARLDDGWSPDIDHMPPSWVKDGEPCSPMIPPHVAMARFREGAHREVIAFQTTEALVKASRQALTRAVRSAQAWPDDMLIAMRSAAYLLRDGCEPHPELAQELKDHADAVEALAAQPPAQPVPERDPLWLRAAMAGIRGTDWALRRLANRSRR